MQLRTHGAGKARGHFSRQLICAAVSALPIIGVVDHAAAQSLVTWVGATGNWSTAANWSPATVPNAADADVKVDSGNPIHSLVNVDGNFTVGRLTIDAGDEVSLNNNDTFVIANGSFSGSGTLTNNGTLFFNNLGSGIDLKISGDVSFLGSGVVSMNNVVNNRILGVAGTERLTIGANQTIAGSGQIGVNAMALTNNGTIDANLPGGLTIQPSAGGATNSASGIWQASAGGTLKLQGAGGSFTNNNIIRALDTSAVQLINGAVLNGGTVTTSGTGVVQITAGGGALNGVTNTGAISITNNIIMTLGGGSFVNNGSVSFNNQGSGVDIQLSGNLTLSGTGTLLLNNFGNNRILGASGNGTELLTVAASQTIEGAGQIGANALSVLNNGTINANLSNILTLQPFSAGSFTNAAGGILQASGGGTLRLQNGSFANNNIIQALDTSTVQLFSNATVTGGTLTTAGTGVISVNGNGNTLNGVTNTGSIAISNGVVLGIGGGTFLNNGTVAFNNLGSGISLSVNGDLSLNGSGTLLMNSVGGNRIIGTTGTERLTIGASQTIQGSGTIGANTLALTSNGTINANINGTTLTIQPNSGGATNSTTGIWQASNGGVLRLANGTFTNNHIIQALDTSEVQIDANAILLGGTLTTSGSGDLRVTDNGAVLSGVTNTGSLVINNGRILTLAGGSFLNNGSVFFNNAGSGVDLKITGDVSLTGSGTITMDNVGGNRILGTTGTERLTVGSLQTVQGSGSLGADFMSLTNNGTIDANQSIALAIQPNAGGSAINNGTWEASAGGILVLQGGGGTFANNGTLEALNASEVQLGGNPTLTGTLATSGTGVVRAVSNPTLNGVTNNGSFIINNGITVTLGGGSFVNNGSLLFNNAGSGVDLKIAGDVSLTGNGTITMDNIGGNRILGVAGTERLTVGSLQTVQGSGSFGANFMSLTNNGTINANQSIPLAIQPNAGGSAINNGTWEASNGGVLILQGGGGTFANNGTLEALDASEVQLGGNPTVSGTLSTSGTGVIRATSNATLNGVTNNGSFIINNGISVTLGAGSFVNNGSLLFNNAGSGVDLLINGNLSLTGNGTITMDNVGGNRILGVAGAERLTVGSLQTVQGSGSFGANFLSLTNNGAIIANQPNPLTVLPAATGDATNGPTGLWEAANGATLRLQSGGGSFTSNGTIAALDGSTVTFDAASVLSNDSAGTLAGGTYRSVSTANPSHVILSGAAITNIAGSTTVELNGAQSSLTSAGATLESSLVVNNGTLKILGSRSFIGANALANGSTPTATAILQLGGGTFDAPGLTNEASSSITGFGAIVPRPLNHGTIQAIGGTLAFSNGINGGSGTIEATNGATIDLSAGANDSSADDLLVDSSDHLNLGTHNVTVAVDYNNANAGTGNSFNPHANVSGTGQINASPAVTQSITGASVSGGTTVGPTISLGNIRVGSTTFATYQIANSAGGPMLRGAIENNNAGAGASVTDTRLSGAGVSPANFGPIAGGFSTGVQTIQFSGTASGPLSGQKIGIVNNFDNVADQSVSITGAAYAPAIGAVAPASINFGNFHVGDLVSSQPIAIVNIAPSGAFSEDLLASNFVPTGDAVIAPGSPTSEVVPAGSSNTSLLARINTNTAGARSGAISATFASNATVNGVAIPGLSSISLGSGGVNVSATVYRLAIPSAPAGSVNFGQYHVGSIATGTIVVSNAAIADAFSEAAHVAVGSFAPDVLSASGSANFAAGSNSGGAIVATLSTATAGVHSGTVQLAENSIAAAQGLSNTPFSSPNVQVTASVYNLASAQINNSQPINLGIVHVGDVVTPAGLSITNSAPVGAFSENLNAVIGSVSTGLVGSGSPVSSLPAGQTNNGSIKVGLDTTTNRVINGTAQINFTSDGTGVNSLGQTALASQAVTITGQVNQYASPLFSKLLGSGTLTESDATHYTLNLGSIAMGSSLSATLRLANTDTAPGDNLAGSFATSGAKYTYTGFGALTPIAPGGSDDSLMISLDTSAPGTFAGQFTLSPLSQNASGFSGALPDVTVNISGTVNTVPEPFVLPLLFATGLLPRRRRPTLCC